MGIFDALVNKPVGTGAFAAVVDRYSPDDRVSVVVTRDSPGRSGGNSTYPTVTTVGTFLATVFRRNEQTINVDQAAPGVATVEQNSIVVAITYADNPGVENWIDGTGASIIHLTDKVKVSGTTAFTDLNATTVVVERIRVYDDGLQLDVRLGTG